MGRYDPPQRTAAQRRAEEIEDRADNYMDILVKGIENSLQSWQSVDSSDVMVEEAFRLADAFQAEAEKRRDKANEGNKS